MRLQGKLYILTIKFLDANFVESLPFSSSFEIEFLDVPLHGIIMDREWCSCRRQSVLGAKQFRLKH